MSIISKLKNKFKTVYCEDCEHAFEKNHFGKDIYCCRKSPLSIDYTRKEDFVTRKRKEVVSTFRECKNVRKNKSYCFKFSKK